MVSPSAPPHNNHGSGLQSRSLSDFRQESFCVCHDDVIKWEHFPRYWSFVRGIHWSPVNSPHKGQWHGALMFSLICAWLNGWVNNRGAADPRRHRPHHDVTVLHTRIHNYVQYSVEWFTGMKVIWTSEECKVVCSVCTNVWALFLYVNENVMVSTQGRICTYALKFLHIMICYTIHMVPT